MINFLIGMVVMYFVLGLVTIIIFAARELKVVNKENMKKPIQIVRDLICFFFSWYIVILKEFLDNT